MNETEEDEALEGVERSDPTETADRVFQMVTAAAIAKEEERKKQQQKKRRKTTANQQQQQQQKKQKTGEKEKEVNGDEESETERDYLVRTGMVTPFQSMKGMEKQATKTATNEGTTHLGGEGNAEEIDEQIDVQTVQWKDDGDERIYKERLNNAWRNKKRSPNDVSDEDENDKSTEEQEEAIEERTDEEENEEIDDLMFGSPRKQQQVEQTESNGQQNANNRSSFIEFEGGFRISTSIYNRMYLYQQVGVKWLWELYCQEVGGILGDEMGLGKTIISIAFISGLYSSNKLATPLLIVCPATVMTQWVQEFHKWFPPIRVIILHDTSTAGERAFDFVQNQRLFDSLGGTILITTYESIRINQDIFSKRNWSNIFLDEGHKIRNPDAEITLACKRFKTPHRIIMTGTPIQNNLKELWSLMDFVFPGKLGTLPVFQQHFSDPINRGGYQNASQFMAQTAYKCAAALRDTISPYMLRRLKRDVLPQLPKKTEEVLLCKLTDEQRSMYETFLSSSEMKLVIHGKKKILFAIDMLRKICNHPDLVLHPQSMIEGKKWIHGVHEKMKNLMQEISDVNRFVFRSGKLKVLKQLLDVWKPHGHKVLIFTQTRQMLNLIEPFINAFGYVYKRLDGTTPVKERMKIIEAFNTDPNIFLFILTTHVGGIGVNLTGADRVVIYDPDWNPSTDEQARERVLRIGQDKAVKIYRLITAGTIEEKMYHRQLFKSFLKNRVLKDPLQKRLFRENFLKELFSFTPKRENQQNEEEKPDTAKIFGDIQENHDEEEKEKDGDDDDDEKSGSDGNRDEMNDDNGRAQETMLLKKLFDGTDVASTVSHDAIIEGDAEKETEKAMLDYEASKIARRSLEALKKSRQDCSTSQLSIPTWTGRSGLIGAPERFKRFGRSSSAIQTTITSSQSILESISSNTVISQQQQPSKSKTPQDDFFAEFAEPPPPPPSKSPPTQRSQTEPLPLSELIAPTITPPSTTSQKDPSEKLAEDLYKFFLGCKKCEATSEEIVRRFANAVSGNKMKPLVLKQVLRKIAILNTSTHSWTLKDSWKNK